MFAMVILGTVLHNRTDQEEGDLNFNITPTTVSLLLHVRALSNNTLNNLCVWRFSG